MTTDSNKSHMTSEHKTDKDKGRKETSSLLLRKMCVYGSMVGFLLGLDIIFSIIYKFNILPILGAIVLSTLLCYYMIKDINKGRFATKSDVISALPFWFLFFPCFLPFITIARVLSIGFVAGIGLLKKPALLSQDDGIFFIGLNNYEMMASDTYRTLDDFGVINYLSIDTMCLISILCILSGCAVGFFFYLLFCLLDKF